MRCFTIILICFAFAISIDCASIGSSESDSSESSELVRQSPELKTDEFLKQKCFNRTGNDDAFQSYLNQKEDFKQCVLTAVDAENLRGDFQNVQQGISDYSSMFKKYCPKREALLKCVKDYSKVIEVCYTEEELRTSKLFENVTNGVLDFVCDHDGAEIVKFIDNQGIQCVSETGRNNGLKACLENVATKYGLTGTPDASSILTVNEKWCEITDTFRQCVTAEFNQCSSKVPSEVVGSFFDHIRAHTECAKKSPTSDNEV